MKISEEDYIILGKACLNILDQFTNKGKEARTVSISDLGRFYHKALVTYKVLGADMLSTLIGSWAKRGFSSDEVNRILRYYADTNSLLERQKKKERRRAYERTLS